MRLAALVEESNNTLAGGRKLQPPWNAGILTAYGRAEVSVLADDSPLPPAETPPPETPVPAVHHAHARLPTFKFVEELKRRNVGRVAILYLVIGYLILEVFGVFVHLLELPAWIGRSVVLLMVIGFPVALLVAWIYEITPEGLKPTEEVAPQKSIRYQTGKRLDRAIIAALAIALSYFIVDKFWLSAHKSPVRAEAAAEPVAAPVSTPQQSASLPATNSTLPPTLPAVTPRNSVAVLPFLDMSEKHDQEYFSDGLSEELIDMLVKVPGLSVPARTSSFYFKGKQVTIAEIAKALGVAHVLEGSVRKSGNALRITAQLIRIDNGYHVWSQTYDRKLDDIFKVQDDIARSVVSALKVALSSSSVIRPIGTQSVEAYTLYLQGKAVSQHSMRDSPEEKIATDYFRQALKIDPAFALAWERLSVQLTDQNRIPEARQASETALRLDPVLPEAHASMARLVILADWDLARADEQLKRALELDPNNSYALSWCGLLAVMRGQFDRGLDYMRRSAELDPLNPLRYSGLSDALGQSGKFADSGVAFDRFLQLNPAAEPYRHCVMASIKFMVGDPAAALAILEGKPKTPDDCPARILVLDALGRHSEADAVFAPYVRDYGTKHPTTVASIYAMRHDSNQAFSWLERAYKQRDFDMLYLKVDQTFKNLRPDPRFDALLKKMKLLP